MKKIITAILIMLLCFTAAACSMGWSDETEIVSVKVTFSAEDQKYYIEITYDDGTIKKIETEGLSDFEGKEGAKGELGNGIAEIKTEYDQSAEETLVTIRFTDESMDDVVFPIPDGKHVTEIKRFDEDETHSEPYLVFMFSDGSSTSEILLPRGKDGNGIKDVKFEESTGTDGRVSGILKIWLDSDADDKPHTFPVTLPVGVKSISTVTDASADKYKILIEYTDGTKQNLEFDRPKDPNTWISESRAPSNMQDGKNGDFFFDREAKVIYFKQDGVWTKIISFKDESVTHSVTFNINTDDTSAKFADGSREKIFSVQHGNYLSSALGNPSVPIPQRTGYTFEGWYTKSVVENTGEEYTIERFGNLTPVCSDLILYARWKKN